MSTIFQGGQVLNFATSQLVSLYLCSLWGVPQSFGPVVASVVRRS